MKQPTAPTAEQQRALQRVLADPRYLKGSTEDQIATLVRRLAAA